MSLFAVTRYMGDDETDDLIDEKQKSNTAATILEKIKAEAKLRKEKRLSDSKSLSSSQKKRKRDNRFEESSNDGDRKEGSQESSGDKEDLSQLSPAEKGKKKKKISDITKGTQKETSDHENNGSDENDLNSESVMDTEECLKDPSKTTEESGFTIMGNYSKKSVQKVERVLPDWLSNPNVITADVRTQTLPVEDMTGLDEDLITKLKDSGIIQFFPVQIQVIPEMLNSLQSGFYLGKAGYRPCDMCVSAPTGSGKTLAFALPIIQALKSTVVRYVRALIILPVRDLAVQVYKVFQTYSKGTNIKVGLLVGQKTFSIEQQSLVKCGLRGFQSQVDVIVATPGRLVDHINQTEGFDLTYLRFLVIDEADKMIEQIKQDWLVQVENAVYKNPDIRPRPQVLTASNCSLPQIPLQKLLFSATLSQNPEKLQQLNLFQPKLFTSVVKGKKSILLPGETTPSKASKLEDGGDQSKTEEGKGEFVGKYTTPHGLSEFYIECTAAMKPLMVLHLLHNLKFSNILCFTNTVEATHRLYHLVRLIGGVEVCEFSSSLPAKQRTRILQKFKANKIDIIICSDAMSRGLDIDGVKYVISYEPPKEIKTYIHRVGRTARAGKVGTAVTLLQKKEFYHFKKMTREAGKSSLKELSISKDSLKPIVPVFEEALGQLPEVLKAEKLKKKSAG